MTATSERLIKLPNSTYLVQTAAGSILVNCPPETLKYILAKGLEIPQMILLPPDIEPGRELGSSGFVRQGINYASVEFLLYANFFVKNRNAHIITPTQHQEQRLNTLLDETFTGPPHPSQYGKFAWLQDECQAVGYYPPLDRAPNHDDLCNITSLEVEGGDMSHGVKIALHEDHFHIFENGQEIAKIPTKIKGTPRPLTLAPARPLLRHELTLQFIGGSDGFDPAGITTCFLAYLSRDVQVQATLFDTAAYLRMRLGNLGLSTRQISEVVISHLHEDHLAGLPELLLMGEQRHKMRLLTSDVIYESLLRVLSAMLNIPEEDVAALIEYHPLNPGEPVHLEDRRFESIYAIHTIPTIAVRANGLYYSGDMRYDESWFSELVEQEILTAERRDRLIHFAEGADVLVQDAGGGAIHTTITPELLDALAAKGQRVILAHTSQDELSEEQADWIGRVEFASSGHVTNLGDELVEDENVEILETIEACPLFARLPLNDIQALLETIQVVQFKDREIIINDGEESDGSTYLVHSGLVEIWSDEDLVMVVGRGSSIGERGALEGWIRTNNVVAQGNVELIHIDKATFEVVAEKLGLREAFERTDWLWRMPLFSDLLWSTMLDLALDFQPRLLSAGEPLFQIGELAHEIYLLRSGRIKIFDSDHKLIDIMTTPGEFFGSRGALYNTLRNASATAAQDSQVWALPLPALQRLQMVYPHILMHLRAIEGERVGKG